MGDLAGKLECPRCGGSGKVPFSSTESKIVELLTWEPFLYSSDLMRLLPSSQPNVDYHLLKLEKAGIVARGKRTKWGFPWRLVDETQSR